MSKKKLDYLGVSAFAESMAMMIKAGVSTEEAILLLQQDNNHGLLADALDLMAKETSEGKTFYEAMYDTGIFPDYALEMVKAGEKTGKLEKVMSSLADYYQNEKEISDKLKTAVVYPASMIVMIIVVLLIMLFMVLPVFTDVYDKLTASSFRYISFAYTICRVLLIIMVAIFLLVVICYAMWKAGKKKTVEKFLRIIPGVSAILDEMGTFRFTNAYAIYLSSGMYPNESLQQSMQLVDCEPVEKILEKCAEDMEEGHGFAYAANKEGLYEPIYAKMLVPAERSGNTDEALNRLIDLLKADINTMVSNLVNTVEPLLSGILMISIGLVLVSLMLPLIGMMNSIG